MTLRSQAALTKLNDATFQPQGSSPCYVYPVWHFCKLARYRDERSKATPFPHGGAGVCTASWGEHGVPTGGPAGMAACVPALALRPARCSLSVVLPSSSSFAVTRGGRGLVRVGSTAIPSEHRTRFSLVWMTSRWAQTVVLGVWAQEQEEYLCLHFSDRHFNWARCQSG